MEAMLSALPLGVLLNGSGWVVAFWVVFYLGRMVYDGRLVPRKTHEDALKTVEIERTRNEVLTGQLDTLTDSMRVIDQFIHSLPTAQPPQSQSGNRARGGR